jgi:N-methylhydantoinase A/oxoprolinase/acetone carboxylase beta subunit
VLSFLSEKDLDLPAVRPRPAGEARDLAVGPRDRDMARWFFLNSLYRTHPQLETQFRLKVPIVGIGAPAGIMLTRAAADLSTDLVLPEFHQVANAVGAVAGSVMVTEELLIYPHLDSAGLEVMAYFVQASDQRQEFDALGDAMAYARTLSEERALGAAVRSGADNPQVTITVTSDGLDTYRVRAKAMGNPRLAR